MGFWEGKEAPILQRIEIKGAIQGRVCASLHKKKNPLPRRISIALKKSNVHAKRFKVPLLWKPHN